MIANTGKLAGKTLFITGSSRGIGKAIALKAAKDGANIVIAAKTTEPHPKLPGTIYTAAKEVEEAGGKCLPCAVNLLDETTVHKAVEDAVKTFGGIDILVNNASVINLTGTLETTLKKYDLMNKVNARGTYVCSQACLPYLKAAKNPHILNITVPMTMRHDWFRDNIAYSISKFGMTLCVLGMSQEFKNDGIAVNGLWPKKSIATAAVEVLSSSKEAVLYCRKDTIMADAAYVMLTRDSRSRTGEFFFDEDVLKEEGITDFTQYLVSPETVLAGSDTSESPTRGVAEVFDTLKSFCNKEVAQSVDATFEFHLSGKEPGVWYIDMKDNEGRVGSGPFPGGEVGCTMIMESEDFVRMFQGQVNSMQLAMLDRLEPLGHRMLALQLQKLIGKVKSKL